METEKWGKIKEILEEALKIEPSARKDFLNACGASADIRAEVESLLAFEDDAGDMMRLSAVEYSKDFFSEEEKVETGNNVGAYRIIRELGLGGMGVVYLAERVDGKFAQRVAIKMLRREFNIKTVRHRFEVEKDIQSTLDHPNIARLIDAGTTAEGVPYLVMEYIDGLPIDVFCRVNVLALADRLKLFNKVCDAVAAAHRNLVVHRDLKPSNILVTEGGEPKLLDFGISKLLDEKTKDDNSVTLLSAMTPEYASPEQIRGESVSTATDIYSLGVVLFKSLTDALPLDLKGKTNGELLKTIGETEPRIASEVNSERRSPGAESRNEKQSTPQAIRSSQLKGDIDNIVSKSLSKEPERRYQTVEQFSDDIWRFIDDRPVMARPASFSYKASKFFRRNKIAVLAACLILISLITGLAVAVWQANTAREQARIASEARTEAELETQKARAEEEKAEAEKAKTERISSFMSKVLSYANPAWYAEGAKFSGDAKLIDVMDDLSEKIDTDFPDQPDIQAELHHKFGEVYFFHGLKTGETEAGGKKALYHARRALELRRIFYGERHELVAKDMFSLWGSGGVSAMEEAEYLAKAIQMMRETNPHNLNLPYMLEAYTARLMMPDSKEKHEKYLRAIIPGSDENKYQVAEKYLLEALPTFREYYKEDNIAIFINECKLTYAQTMQRKFTEARPHYDICRESVDKLHDEKQIEGIKRNLSYIDEAAAANGYKFSN